VCKTVCAEQRQLTLSMVCTMQLPALMLVLLSDVGRSGRAYTYGLPLQQHNNTLRVHELVPCFCDISGSPTFLLLLQSSAGKLSLSIV
jgi:hypothetical protein